MNKQDSDWLEELKKTAITKFHNDHNDGDVAIYELVRGIQTKIAEIIGEDEIYYLDDTGKELNRLRAEQRKRAGLTNEEQEKQ